MVWWSFQLVIKKIYYETSCCRLCGWAITTAGHAEIKLWGKGWGQGLYEALVINMRTFIPLSYPPLLLGLLSVHICIRIFTNKINHQNYISTSTQQSHTSNANVMIASTWLFKYLETAFDAHGSFTSSGSARWPDKCRCSFPSLCWWPLTTSSEKLEIKGKEGLKEWKFCGNGMHISFNNLINQKVFEAADNK